MCARVCDLCMRVCNLCVHCALIELVMLVVSVFCFGVLFCVRLCCWFCLFLSGGLFCFVCLFLLSRLVFFFVGLFLRRRTHLRVYWLVLYQVPRYVYMLMYFNCLICSLMPVLFLFALCVRLRLRIIHTNTSRTRPYLLVRIPTYQVFIYLFMFACSLVFPVFLVLQGG